MIWSGREVVEREREEVAEQEREEVAEREAGGGY